MKWSDYLIFIETERLYLRSWQLKDLAALIEMNQDPKVMKYFPSMLNVDQTKQFFHIIQKEFTEKGFGLYAAEVKETNECIGFIGFHEANFSADFTPCIEIGWRLKYSAWNQGYATEGAKACVQYGFTSLGFKDIYSFTAKVNTRSEHIMKKIGMTYIKNFPHPKVDDGSLLKEHVLYRAQCEKGEN